MKHLDKASSLLALVKSFEGLSSDRLAVSSIISDEIKSIDEQRKALKERAVELVKSVSSAIDATAIANGCCPALPPKSDNASHKRMARRRSWLVGVLSSSYSDYDFVVPARSVTIVAEYVGSASHREARELLVAVERLAALGFHIPAISETDITTAIAAQTVSSPVQVIDVSSDFAAALARIQAKTASFAGMLDGETNKTETAKKAKKEKVA